MDSDAQCPACGAAGDHWRTARASDARLAGRDGYSLLRCRSCATAWVAPEELPADPSVLYRGGTYEQPSGVVERLLEPLRRLADRERLWSLRSLPSGARVFEVGAGDGRFLEALAGRGYLTDGTEPFAAPGAWATARAAAEELALPAQSQDAIVFWHVLEHLARPGEALARVRDALAPGGRLVVAVPNACSVQARIGGDRWFHQDVPRHAVLFSEAGLRALLRDAGFELLPARHLGVQQNLLGMWQTLLNRLTRDPDVAFRALKRGAPRPRLLDLAVTVVAGILLLPVAPLIEWSAGLARRGGALVVVAHRVERPA